MPSDQTVVQTTEAPMPVTVPMKSPERDMLLINVHERLARMETKLDFVVDTVGDHESRIRSSERWRWGIPGGFVATLLAVIGINLPHS